MRVVAGHERYGSSTVISHGDVPAHTTVAVWLGLSGCVPSIICRSREGSTSSMPGVPVCLYETVVGIFSMSTQWGSREGLLSLRKNRLIVKGDIKGQRTDKL